MLSRLRKRAGDLEAPRRVEALPVARPSFVRRLFKLGAEPGALRLEIWRERLVSAEPFDGSVRQVVAVPPVVWPAFWIVADEHDGAAVSIELRFGFSEIGATQSRVALRGTLHGDGDVCLASPFGGHRHAPASAVMPSFVCVLATTHGGPVTAVLAVYCAGWSGRG